MAERIRVFTVPNTPSSSLISRREPIEHSQDQRSPLVAGKPSQRLPQQLRVHHLRLDPVLVWSPGLQGDDELWVDRVEPSRRQHVDRHVAGRWSAATPPPSSPRIAADAASMRARSSPGPLPAAARSRRIANVRPNTRRWKRRSEVDGRIGITRPSLASSDSSDSFCTTDAPTAPGFLPVPPPWETACSNEPPRPSIPLLDLGAPGKARPAALSYLRPRSHPAAPAPSPHARTRSRPLIPGWLGATR